MKHLLRSVAVAVPLVVLASWPLARPAGQLVQRNADGYGSAWLVWRLGEGGSLGDLQFVDTLLFGLLAPLVAPFGPALGYHLVTLLALVLGVVVAERVAARVFGSPWPASLVAGLAFGLSPLAGTALAEGHGGMLLGAGLALLLGALEREPGERPWRWAALVTLAGCLCALQSGYFGVMAALVVGVYGGLRRRPVHRVALLAAAPAAAYVVYVLGTEAMALEAIAMRVGDRIAPAATADSLAGVPPGMGLAWYHVRFPLLFGLLALGGLLPLLRGQGPDRALALTGLVAVALSFGAEARLTVFSQAFQEQAIGAPWGWLTWAFAPLGLFRFPTRFLWVWYLCGGMAAARLVGWLVQSRGRWLLTAVVFAELLVLGMRPWEPREVPAEVPSAYEVLRDEHVVLDLWPWYTDSLSLPLLNLSCYYQTAHAADLPYPCLTVASRTSPLRSRVDAMVAAVMDDDPSRARTIVKADGITHIAWHPDAFPPEGRKRMQDVLKRWFGFPLATSRNGGELVVLWAVRSGYAATESPVAPWPEPGDGTCASCLDAVEAAPPTTPRDPVPPWTLLLAGALLAVPIWRMRS